MQEIPYKTHWSITEIATRHGLTSEGVRKWIVKKSLFAQKVGRTWMVTDSDLKAFEEKEGMVKTFRISSEPLDCNVTIHLMYKEEEIT